ncbi:MAG: polyisoprenoid-binding protein [Pedobacter sp.]|nr:MAG: polyisoprenoid-binding protein [Pedobacter sp.]
MNNHIISDQEKANWVLDPIHSDLAFNVRHLMISSVAGTIKSFDLNLNTVGTDFGDVTDLQLKIAMSSLTTNHEPRDEYLKSEAFFHVEQYPHIKFQGIFFEKQGQHPPTMFSAHRRDYKLRGKLTIKGISRVILLNGEFGGTTVTEAGVKHAGFTIRGTISRAEFGLSLAGLEGVGKLILADEVDIIGNILLTKQT